MLITDIFSHKIHSSSISWTEKLIDIATIFAKFDGHVYNRDLIIENLKEISPRASKVSRDLQKGIRDVSKFRDEITAYPAYLGLYHIKHLEGKWILQLSEAAKIFLINEEPDVASFLVLQLLLFQYPNSLGATYSKSNISIKPNAAQRTLNLLKNGLKLCPFRLICQALLADSQINGIGPHHPRVSIEEFFLLANSPEIYRYSKPNLIEIIDRLKFIREHKLAPTSNIERRFHILNHTDFVQVTNNIIHLRDTVSPADGELLISRLHAVSNLSNYFDGFDTANDSSQIGSIVKTGDWAEYFDGVKQFSTDTIQILTGKKLDDNYAELNLNYVDVQNIESNHVRFSYPLKERGDAIYDDELHQININNSDNYIDPEVINIKRQKSNLNHRIIIQKLDEMLRSKGATPKENEHIDLYVKLDANNKFLFEVKSLSVGNLLSQTRKGISQLYEYRYRYSDIIGHDVSLCLVFPFEPKEIEWLQHYLCIDRTIYVCWFEDDNFCTSVHCKDHMTSLINA
jgi:hypothetical protein